MPNQKVNAACDASIKAISRGDREALSCIYDCMARMIYSVAFAVTENEADAEDVLQDTMIEIVKYAPTYKSGTNARAWILAIARHRAIDTVRKRRSTIPLDDEALHCIPAAPEEMPGTVQELLGVLNEEERQLVVFRIYQELSYIEISGIMKISVSAAQKRYQRAVKKLKQFYH